MPLRETQPGAAGFGQWLRGRISPPHRTRQRSLSLALQGGGSHGAFTWGVIDRLLQDDRIVFDAVSGASAGAVNAVLLADGLARGDRAETRARIERFWRRIGTATATTPFGTGPAVALMIDLSSRVASPYQINPLGLNPLRDILAAEIDFETLRVRSPVRLLIAATNVKDGRPRLFREHEITVDAVLASACLPFFHHAVEIDGEWYWDGGYSANPPLRQLIADSAADDVLLVQLTPEREEKIPFLPREIARRVDQMIFNGPLRREIEALDDLRASCRNERFFRSRFAHRLQRLRLHTIAAAQEVDGLSETSALKLDWKFLTRLKEAGSAAADKFLAKVFPQESWSGFGLS